MTPYYDKDGMTIYCGDCVDVLPELGRPCTDAVVTDPPYMIGAHSTGTEARKAGSWGDLMNVARWYSQWLALCRDACRSEGSIWVFGNWRSLPTYMKAFEDARLPVTSCVVWDKEWIGPAYQNALRPTWELILMSAMPECVIADRSASDLIRCKWMAGNCRTTAHPAEKPVELISRLLALSTPPNGRVLDAFCGSGTTLVAAKRLGRRAIGIEVNEHYCAMAVERLRQGLLPLTAA